MSDPSETPDSRAKLSRFQALLFGTEIAKANGDHETSLGLGLRLAGFLDSEVETAEDEVYLRKIIGQVNDNIDSACRATQSTRRILDLANCPPGFKFTQSRPTDLDRVKRSKYLRHIFHPTETLQQESEPSSAKGPTVHPEPSTLSRERTPVQKPDCKYNSAERIEPVSGLNFSPPATGRQGSSGLHDPRGKGSSSRSLLPAVDVCPSLNEDQLNREQGHFSDVNRPGQERPRPESEDDGE